jgi:hypothetical protein
VISWPEQLIEDVGDSKLVLFLGSGVSAGCQNSSGIRPPTWKAFLENALERVGGTKRVVKSLIKTRDYLTAAEILRNRFDSRQWQTFIETTFRAPRFQANDLIKAIFKLNLSVVITTNYDSIYEDYVRSVSKEAIQVVTHTADDLAVRIRSAKSLLVKMHGSVDEPQKIILTRSEYRDLRFTTQVYDVLNALLLTRTFLFVGYSLGDPDLQLMLENFKARYVSGPIHYVCFPKPMNQELIDAVEEAYGLKVLLYDRKNNYLDLTKSFDELVRSVEENAPAEA